MAGESKLTENEKQLVGQAFADISTRLVNHKATLDKLAASDKAEHAKVLEVAEEIRRLKEWTGLPEKNDPRGPAPGTLWGMAAFTRNLVLLVCKHVGLDEDDIMPPTKGGAN